jgi:hypothetical protein
MIVWVRGNIILKTLSRQPDCDFMLEVIGDLNLQDISKAIEVSLEVVIVAKYQKSTGVVGIAIFRCCFDVSSLLVVPFPLHRGGLRYRCSSYPGCSARSFRF